MPTDLYRPEFTDTNKAREWLEAELWADGRPCPRRQLSLAGARASLRRA